MKTELNLHLSLENDAFQDGHLQSEVAGILRLLADKIENDPLSVTLWYHDIRDCNGNGIGTCTIE